MNRDPHFSVDVLTQTPMPQTTVWLSMHQCVTPDPVSLSHCPTEGQCGEFAVKHAIKKGHYSICEGPAITFRVAGFNHRTMQQVTRHRIGTHFSVQSLRYTGDQFAALANDIAELRSQGYKQSELIALMEPYIYMRPVGKYRDRNGNSYDYTMEERFLDFDVLVPTLYRYADKVALGCPHEQAAGLLPMDTRQHWVMSFNIRSLMAFFDRRYPANAQNEARQLCSLMWPHFWGWCPEIASWYADKRKGKSMLAP